MRRRYISVCFVVCAFFDSHTAARLLSYLIHVEKYDGFFSLFAVIISNQTKTMIKRFS